jgi:hypothetical protein
MRNAGTDVCDDEAGHAVRSGGGHVRDRRECLDGLAEAHLVPDHDPLLHERERRTEPLVPAERRGQEGRVQLELFDLLDQALGQRPAASRRRVGEPDLVEEREVAGRADEEVAPVVRCRDPVAVTGRSDRALAGIVDVRLDPLDGTLGRVERPGGPCARLVDDAQDRSLRDRVCHGSEFVDEDGGAGAAAVLRGLPLPEC